MLDKKIFLLNTIIFFIMVVTVFAANERENQIELKDVEATLLTTIEGRLSLQDFNGERLLILTTTEGKNYALNGELAEENLMTIKELEKKKVVVAGIPGNIHKKTIEIQQFYDAQAEKLESRTGQAWEYTKFLVLYIDKIEDAPEEVITFRKKGLEYPWSLLPPSQTNVLPHLRQMAGRVKSINLRGPIPTIDIQELTKKREAITLIIHKDTVVVKVKNNQALRLFPTTIKEGDSLDLWYSTEKDKNLAHIITILDK